MKDLVFVASTCGDILFMNKERGMLFGFGNSDKTSPTNLFEWFSEKVNEEIREKINYTANRKLESIDAFNVETIKNSNCKVLTLKLHLIYDIKYELIP